MPSLDHFPPQLASGSATSAKQDTGNTSLASIDTKLTNPLPISGTVTANTGLTQPLTDTQLRASNVSVSVVYPLSANIIPSHLVNATAAGLTTDISTYLTASTYKLVSINLIAETDTSGTNNYHAFIFETNS